MPIRPLAWPSRIAAVAGARARRLRAEQRPRRPSELTVDDHRRRLRRVRGHDRAGGHRHLRAHQHRQRRQRVRDPRRRQAAHRGREGERHPGQTTSPTSRSSSPAPTTRLQVPAGRVADRLAEFTVTGEAVAVDADDAGSSPTTAVANYVAYVKSQAGELIPAVQAFADAYAAGDDETARAVRDRPASSTSASSRRPRRSATSTRRSTTARSTPSPRASTGPASTASRRTSGRRPRATSTRTARALCSTGRRRRPRRARRPSATGSSPTCRSSTTWSTPTTSRVTLADISQRRHRPARRGRGRQDHRRRGLVVAHRPHRLRRPTCRAPRWRSATCRRSPQQGRRGHDAGRPTSRSEFDALDALLAQYGSIDAGFTSYDQVTDAQRKELSDEVNALAEPLSQLTRTVLGV